MSMSTQKRKSRKSRKRPQLLSVRPSHPCVGLRILVNTYVHEHPEEEEDWGDESEESEGEEGSEDECEYGVVDDIDERVESESSDYSEAEKEVETVRHNQRKRPLRSRRAEILALKARGEEIDWQRRSNTLIDLGFVEHLVMDECDKMLEMGFFVDIKRLYRLLPKPKKILKRGSSESNLIDVTRLTI